MCLSCYVIDKAVPDQLSESAATSTEGRMLRLYVCDHAICLQ